MVRKTFGRKSTLYSAPRYVSVWPFCRPKPRTSETVRPVTPSEVTVLFHGFELRGADYCVNALHNESLL